MSRFEALLRPDRGEPATALRLVDKKSFDQFLKNEPEPVRDALRGQGFVADGYQVAIVPAGRDWSAVLGVANVDELSPWCLAKAAEMLPEGSYRVEGRGPGPAVLGWLLAQYGFDRYRKEAKRKGPRILLTDEPARIEGTVGEAEATALVRDLVNLPAADMGPGDLVEAARHLAEECGAELEVTLGEPLERDFPMIAAVGRAAAPGREPRLIELRWGDQRHPRIALVGKGVCFDTGGLDIKNSAGMRLMKKDMGGAAHALALAALIMRSRLPVRLHLLVPAVENSVSGAAVRPGDVLASRKGLSVEVTNTDAEGRLVLADAITRAAEEEPELLLDFATLTGAARVALGPDLPALFASDEALAADLLACSEEVTDPLWRMPLWPGYEEMLASDVADLVNCPDGGFAGAVTAALFLKKFVPETIPWAHVDTFAWRAAARPARPKGGDALGVRAAWALLQRRYAS